MCVKERQSDKERVEGKSDIVTKRGSEGKSDIVTKREGGRERESMLVSIALFGFRDKLINGHKLTMLKCMNPQNQDNSLDDPKRIVLYCVKNSLWLI